MKYKLTKAEQETVINFDNELDTASIYTHDSRLIKKLRELRKQYPEQFILEHREHGSVTYTIPKRCVGIRPPYSEKRREQQRQEAKENGLPFMEKGEIQRFKTVCGMSGDLSCSLTSFSSERSSAVQRWHQSAGWDVWRCLAGDCSHGASVILGGTGSAVWHLAQ